MRRQDREVTDGARIDSIIESCDCCRLGLFDGTRAYIVPLSFLFRYENGARVLYFHCALEGKKLTLARERPAVCFEMDTAHRFVAGSGPMDNTMLYQCVMGEGSIGVVESVSDKRSRIGELIARYRRKADPAFFSPPADGVTVLRLAVERISCKENRAAR
ncbi:MAG: pyridoxamine 5'-phosphate oxidase family protein [Oscillospiraceae bacterium]|nr:pyridoxamine 5'-phosphate oxidase family protein [Oscillospiraceae bacterium]